MRTKACRYSQIRTDYSKFTSRKFLKLEVDNNNYVLFFEKYNKLIQQAK